ncbi:MAG: DUF2723 domain-containing protein [Prevotella sp.]|nr:DUF2723 domain-containing protein [Prevotella sp.]
MKKFRIVDNSLGWLAFLIAAVTYCLTVEPTASFWDCPEFITTGYKLEIGHPPGAPFFMLTANLFSQFASDPTQVAFMVNIMNALLSAVCIMFLFWSITHLARKLILKDWSELTTGKLIAIEAAGLVGALIYAWSDTFWYSAVEGEVYAYSSAFTAVVFWLILKWEDQADQPHSDRWLVLIAYMTGLSIGVHLLNLLCIPAIVLVFYYRKSENANLKGSLLVLLLSFVIVAAVLYGVVPGIITVGGWFELLFVNVLGFKFNTGVIIYIILLVAAVIWAICETQNDHSLARQNAAFLVAVAMLGIPFYGYGLQAAIIGAIILVALWAVLRLKKKGQLLISTRVKNTTLLCMLMMMIGYSTYAVIVIRSAANPPMDQNSPEDIFTLGNYLSRDQYGYRPLLYGQAYNSEYAAGDDGYVKMTKQSPIYQRREKASADEPDRYFIVDWKQNPQYVQNMFFPRMYSSAHASLYESIIEVKGRMVPSAYGQPDVKMPTMLDNLKFFFAYQYNFMYWRYFMWNFAGRQNDIQGSGEKEHGNWLTGIPFFDNHVLKLGDQNMLPDVLKENKGHNVFYCLPLLLGLLGLFWQAMRGERGIRQFWVVFFLFFMTGLAIVVYLNQTPNQPRERDYAYAGSFYAFAIWCGLGVTAIIDWLRKLGLKQTAVAALAGLACLCVPLQMVSQTWDDHDRSGRYTCRDFGLNYLNSLQENGYPIIFTNGDNDTFPLWYNQETEGNRTDVRVCNLSYLQTDWYIDQMLRPAYDSPPVPITWPRIDYCSGTNDVISVRPEIKEAIKELYDKYPEEAKSAFGDNPYELSNVLKFWVRGALTPEQRQIKNSLLQYVGIEDDAHVVPTDTLLMTIDKDAVKKSGMKLAYEEIPETMVISLEGRRSLAKNDLMMLEMISRANWTRPIYVAITVGEENYMNLGDNFIQEGLVNRITPFTTAGDADARFDADKTYDYMMNKFKFGGLDKPGLYLDQTVMRMCATHRRLFSQLALALLKEGKTDKAKKVLEKCEKEIPDYNVPMDYMSGGLDLLTAWGNLGDKKHATDIADKLWKQSEQFFIWYISSSPSYLASSKRDCDMHIYIMQGIAQEMDEIDRKWSDEHINKLNQLYGAYQTKLMSVN